MKTKQPTSNREGYCLVTTLFIMTAISTLMAMLVHSGSQQIYTTRRMTNRIKATAYAEAGFEYALAQLKNDWNNRNNVSACVPAP